WSDGWACVAGGAAAGSGADVAAPIEPPTRATAAAAPSTGLHCLRRRTSITCPFTVGGGATAPCSRRPLASLAAGPPTRLESLWPSTPVRVKNCQGAAARCHQL